MVADGVLEPCGQSAWATPTFIVPKKDNIVQWVSDFRELNKIIKRKPFPMAKIQDMMNCRGKYSHFTKIAIDDHLLVQSTITSLCGPGKLTSLHI